MYSHDPLRTRPEETVMNDQKIGARGYRFFNSSERSVDRRCDTTDGAIVLKLQAIQSLVGCLRDSEVGIEVAYDFGERNLQLGIQSRTGHVRHTITTSTC